MAKPKDPFRREPEVNLFGEIVEPKNGKRPALQDKFLVPPFSVLDARQGYWQERKRQWIDLGIEGELGREKNQLGFSEVCNTNGGYHTFNQKTIQEFNTRTRAPRSPGAVLPPEASRQKRSSLLNKGEGYEWGEAYEGGNAWAGAGSSVFDPVLAEVVYRWFAPAGGKILDPFAGDSTKGLVAECLGYRYTGIELRPEQCEANELQAAKLGVAPHWICGDSSQLLELLPQAREGYEEYDLIFTSPPYYDLEIYSEAEKDGSAFETYERFMAWYKEIFRQCVKHLRCNRFLVVKVGEIRDADGWYRNFLGDNISCFLDLKLRYYNEAVLVTSVGSLPLRIGKQFAGYRKLGKTHQNLLVFYKGRNPEQIEEKFGREF